MSVPNNLGAKNSALLRVAWVPVVILTLLVPTLWVVNSGFFFESEALVLALNVPFSLLTSLMIAYLIGRSFQADGALALLPFGCGVLSLGAAAVVATAVAGPGQTNLQITIHNSCVWLSAAFHLSGVLLARKAETRLRQTGLWLSLSYGLTLGLLSVVVIGAKAGWFPIFFVQGDGGTPFRQVVVISSILMFAWTARLLASGKRTAFTQWYALALCLAAVGLTAVLIQSRAGSLPNWAGRLTLVLSSVYMLLAAIASVRETGAWSLSLHSTLREAEAQLREQQAREALQESEQRLKLAQAAGVGVYEWDIGAGEVVWSPEIEEIYGMKAPADPRERQKAWLDHVHPADRERALEQIRQCLAGADTNLSWEYRFIRPNGQVRWIAARAAFRRDPGGRVRRVIGTQLDITERKEAEQAIVAERDFTSAVLDTVGALVIVVDRDGRILRFNKACEALAGYSAAEVLHKPFDFLLPPSERERVREGFSRILAGDVPVGFENRWVTKSGEQRLISWNTTTLSDAAGQFTVCIATGLDITEHRRAEESLRDSEAQFRAMFELVSVAKAQADPQTGRLLRVNPAFCTLLGYTEQELVGRSFRDLTHPEDRDRDWAGFQQMVRGEKPSHESRKRYLRKDGAVIWVEVSASVIRDDRGHPARALAVVQDVTERIRAEEALKTSEERLRLATAAARLFAFEWDPLTDRVRRQGDAQKVLGVDFTEESGQSFFQRLHPDDRAGFTELVKSLRPERSFYTTVYRVLRPDGDEAVLEESGRGIFDRTGKFVRLIGMTADITQRSKAEQALRSSEERYRTLVETASEGIWVIDAAAITTFVNPRMADMLGYSVQEMKGKHLFHFMDKDAQAVAVKNLHRREGGVTEQHEFRFKHRDGRDVWTLVSTNPITGDQGGYLGSLAMVTDITGKRATEQELLRSEERLRLAKEAGQIGIHDFNPVTGELHWDSRIRELWGIGPDEPANYDLFISAVHPDDRANTDKAVQRALAPEGDGKLYVEYRLLKNNTCKWLAATGQVTFENGRAVRLVGTVQDITERKDFQAELQRLVAQRTAELQELVGELEHFSYTITHDLKAPLRAMKGYSEIVRMMAEDWGNKEAQEFLDRISASADRMDALIRDALNYSRSVRQELPLEDVDSDRLLRGMLDTYPELQKWKANITVHGRLPVVLGNEAGLTQCFSNLLGNALKFVKPGSIPEIRIWAEDQGAWVRLCVEDHGIGIADSMLHRVFDMFSRGSSHYEGTGIGLALVRKVVQRMGGKVGVSSEQGQWSRFWIELKTGEKKLGATPVFLNPTDAATGVVLYVEDEDTDAVFMARAFARQGIEQNLQRVSDGRAAIDYLSGAGPYSDRVRHPLPTVVLLDLNLPQVSGFEVLRWMRNHPQFAGTPVVVFSSSSREEDRIKARELGADDFVTKPTSGTEFGLTLARIQQRFLPLNASQDSQWGAKRS